MKKSGLIVASLVLAGAAAMAQTPVYSVNTVGYQKLNIVPNLNMLALNWNAVGGSDAVGVQGLVDTANLVGALSQADSDKLYVWNPAKLSGQGGYDLYYFYDSGSSDPVYDRKWYFAENDSLPTTNTIIRGQGMWLLHKGTATTTVMAGEVPTDPTNVVHFGVGLTQFGSAYTATLTFNGANNTWVGHGALSQADSDKIYVWNPSKASGQGGYDLYYFYDSGSADPVYDQKWYFAENDSLPTTNTMAMGSGAWYKGMGPSQAVWYEGKPY